MQASESPLASFFTKALYGRPIPNRVQSGRGHWSRAWAKQISSWTKDDKITACRTSAAVPWIICWTS